jgi:hypothetical protein
MAGNLDTGLQPIGSLEPHPHPHLHLPLPVEVSRIDVQRLPKRRGVRL